MLCLIVFYWELTNVTGRNLAGTSHVGHILLQKWQVFFQENSGTLCFTRGYSLSVLEGPPKWTGLSHLRKGWLFLTDRQLRRCLKAPPQTRKNVRLQIWSPSVTWSSSTCVPKSIHLVFLFQGQVSSSVTNRFSEMAKPLKSRGLKSSRRNSFLHIAALNVAMIQPAKQQRKAEK